MRDLHNNITTSPALNPTAVAADGTTTGATIDRSGFSCVEFSLFAGTLRDGVYTPVIYESDDSGMSGETATADADLIGLEADAAFTADDGEKSELDLGDLGTNIDTVIRAKYPGAAGDLITIAFEDGSGANGGALSRIGTAFTFAFKNGVTTVTNFETAVAALAGADDLIDVKTAGTGANILATADDEFAAEPLAGGVNATASNTVKRVGYKGGKRYVRAKVVASSVGAGGTIAAQAIRGAALKAPVS